MSEIYIRNIRWQEALPLRQSVLRPGLPIEESHFVGDQEPATFHLGAFSANSDVVISIGTFRLENLPKHPTLQLQTLPFLEADLLKADNPYRLRGMAVHPDWRRQGIGEQLLRQGESQLRQRGCELLWFNARQSAFAFYENAGYSAVSDLFSIEGVGPHKVMLKKF